MKNNMNIFFLASVMFVLSCNQGELQDKYDVITVSEYKNVYDEIGRLSNVRIVERQEMYHGFANKKAVVTTFDRLRKYEYKTDKEYTINDYSESFDELRITKYTENTKEEICLKDGKDTVSYSFFRYLDENKPEYMRIIQRYFNLDFEDDDYETYYSYDNNGNNVKKVNFDFNNEEKIEIYNFNGVSLDEASKMIPYSINKQEVICNMMEIINDTVVTQITKNGLPYICTKEFVDKGKKVTQTFNEEMTLTDTSTEYEESGLKVNTMYSVIGGCLIDTVYSQNNRVLKHINIIDDMKIIVTTEYDKEGNVLKEISKTKHGLE